MGLYDAGIDLFEALCADPLIELVAVADRDRERASAMGEQCGAAAFDDYRRVIVEAAATDLDVLFVALPAYEAEEYLSLAAGRELVVFALPPACRRFETMAQIATAYESGRSPLLVGREWYFQPVFNPLRNLEDLAGHVYHAVAEVTSPANDVQGWRGDFDRAGGGVLLHAGYNLTDALVLLLGVPDEVFATSAYSVPPDRARPYNTEDAMSVVCRYGGDRNASLTCRRAGSAASWRLTLYGSTATVEATPQGLTLTDIAGRKVLETPEAAPNRLAATVSAVATGLATGVQQIPCGAGDHLGTMATIEAAYLSVKTGQVESPRRLLELTGFGER